MTQQQVEKRVSFLQYLNSAMIGIVTIIAAYTATTVSSLTVTQTEIATEQAVIKRVQEINVKDVTKLKDDVSGIKDDVAVIKSENILFIQSWVDLNYIRKNQAR
jgi:hypothetical protein